MSLYKVQNGAAVQWTGEPIGGVTWPAVIEWLWTDAELNAIGLFKPVAAASLPTGKKIVSTSVEIVNGVPAYVNVTADLTAADYSLFRFQFLAMLNLSGLASAVTAALASISDPTAKAIAQGKFDATQVFERGDATLNAVATAAGITQAQLDAFWLQAKDFA